MEVLTRMETAKLKVFSSVFDWFEEFRLFHRKNGKVVKEGTASCPRRATG
jgi:hypothetical protein